MPREPPLSSTLSPSSEDSGLDDSSYRSTLEEPETAVEREIRLTLEREERHRRERGMIAHGLPIPRYSSQKVLVYHYTPAVIGSAVLCNHEKSHSNRMQSL